MFTATLVEVVTPEGETYSSVDPERFVFEVDEVFKGKVFARQAIVTARDGASCGLEISGSGPFVVFARLESDGVTTGALEGELYSDLCSGTRALSSGAVPAIFGGASPPIPGATPPIPVATPIGGESAGDNDEGDSGLPIVLILALVGGAAVLSATYTSGRRRAHTRRS